MINHNCKKENEAKLKWTRNWSDRDSGENEKKVIVCLCVFEQEQA